MTVTVADEDDIVTKACPALIDIMQVLHHLGVGSGSKNIRCWVTPMSHVLHGVIDILGGIGAGVF